MAAGGYGIDMGTGNLKIVDRATGEITNEKNTIAIVDKDQMYAYGDEAYAMYEKAPESILVSFPIHGGVIAEFDNITVEKSGQYEFVIELDKNFDGELFWFANPVNAEATDDDFIADFYDGETGEEVFSVPESNLINVNAWLNAEIIYKPVLAVKIK